MFMPPLSVDGNSAAELRLGIGMLRRVSAGDVFLSQLLGMTSESGVHRPPCLLPREQAKEDRVLGFGPLRNILCRDTGLCAT